MLSGKVIIQIGYPKTGSTSLQDAVALTNPNNYYYKYNSSITKYLSGISGYTKQVHCELEKISNAASDGFATFISDEGIMGPLLSDKSALIAQADKLKELFFNPTIICIKRKHDDFLKSLYSELVSFGSCTEFTYTLFKKNVSKYVSDYYLNAELIESIYKERFNDVIFIEYEQYKSDNQIISRLLNERGYEVVYKTTLFRSRKPAFVLTLLAIFFKVAKIFGLNTERLGLIISRIFK